MPVRHRHRTFRAPDMVSITGGAFKREGAALFDNPIMVSESAVSHLPLEGFAVFLKAEEIAPFVSFFPKLPLEAKQSLFFRPPLALIKTSFSLPFDRATRLECYTDVPTAHILGLNSGSFKELYYLIRRQAFGGSGLI